MLDWHVLAASDKILGNVLYFLWIICVWNFCLSIALWIFDYFDIVYQRSPKIPKSYIFLPYFIFLEECLTNFFLVDVVKEQWSSFWGTEHWSTGTSCSPRTRPRKQRFIMAEMVTQGLQIVKYYFHLIGVTCLCSCVLEVSPLISVSNYR